MPTDPHAEATALVEGWWPASPTHDVLAHVRGPLVVLIATALRAAEQRGREKERERCAGLVPLSWLHPFLTGPQAVPNIVDCPSVPLEELLRRIAAAIRRPGGDDGE
jgi:hypothetical protein